MHTVLIADTDVNRVETLALLLRGKYRISKAINERELLQEVQSRDSGINLVLSGIQSDDSTGLRRKVQNVRPDVPFVQILHLPHDVPDNVYDFQHPPARSAEIYMYYTLEELEATIDQLL